ncbi:MAG TPA: ATP-binding protein [Marmoricola sp.]|nr:ATP-binding protein [Marmoricola sp.]
MHRGGGPSSDTIVDTDAWAREALASLCALPGVHRVGLALAEGGGRRLRFTASDRSISSGLRWCHVDAYDDVPLNTAVRSGTLVTGALATLGTRYPKFVARQPAGSTSGIAAVPLEVAGQTLGGFVLFYAEPQPFDTAQCAALVRYGRDLGQELRRAQRLQARAGGSLAAEPVPRGAVVALHDVPAELAAVADARHFLGEVLQRWGIEEDVVYTAAVCMCELVTNALIHTPSGCEVRLLLDDGVLTTTVRDRGAGGLPDQLDHEDPLRVHGRGLELVDALAHRWGSQLDAVGTTVWFTLEV